MKEIVIDAVDINSSSNFSPTPIISNPYPYSPPASASWIDRTSIPSAPSTPEGEVGYALVKEGGKLKAYPMQKIEDAVVNSDWDLPVFDKSLIKWVLRNAKYVRITAKEVKWLEQFYDIIPPDPKARYDIRYDEQPAGKPQTYNDWREWRITPHPYHYNVHSDKTSNVYSTK